MQNLISAVTAEQIVRTVREVSGKDINFISPDGVILASTDKSRIGTYHEIGHRAAAEGKDYEVESDDTYRGTRKGVNLPFVWKGEIAAVIGITGEPDEVRKYALLAQRITRLILKERELDTLDRSRQAQAGYIVRQLIHGEAEETSSAADYLEQNGIRKDELLRTVVVRISLRCHPANLTLAEEEIYQVFRKSGSPLYTFLYPDQYILILKNSSYRSFRPELEILAAGNREFLAVGAGSAEVYTEILRSYQSGMLAVAAAAAQPGQPAEYDRLHTELLLGTLPKEALELYVHRVLSALDEKDLRCLEAYFRCNCSLKAAAAELFIHKNTLQYHLDRVRILSGYDPRRFSEAADLMLALRCRALAGA